MAYYLLAIMLFAFLTNEGNYTTMKKILSYSVVVAVLACGFAESASASSCLGNCGTLGADGVVTAPPNGGDYQYVSTDGGAAINGSSFSSYVTDSFSVSAGDKLQFFVNYVTSDGGAHVDYADVTLRPQIAGFDYIKLFTASTTPAGDTVPGFGQEDLAAGVVLDPASTPIIPGAPEWSALGTSSGTCYDDGCGYTGWISVEYIFTEASTYTLNFGVANIGNTSWDSGLAFAGITLNGKPIEGGGGSTVPEPATLTLMLASLGLVGALRRRNKKAPTA
ncbi:MAG: NF038132 family protein [Azonexus sp.]|jgi:hypothetical protein|nr:NF038132 family protein [Azonexus sp.]